MNETDLKREIARAKTAYSADAPEFLVGYLRGLRRGYHGENFGNPGEHELWLAMPDSLDACRQRMGAGYLAGLEAADACGRPIGYSPPTAGEARALIASLHLTGAAAGALIDIDSRTVRRWTGGERNMPFAALYAIVHRTVGRTCTPSDWREELADLL